MSLTSAELDLIHGYFSSPIPLAHQCTNSTVRAQAELTKHGSRLGKHKIKINVNKTPLPQEAASLDYTSTIVVTTRLRRDGYSRLVEVPNFSEDAECLAVSAWWLLRPFALRPLPIHLRAGRIKGIADTTRIPAALAKEVLCVLNVSNSGDLTGVNLKGLQQGALEELRVSFCGRVEAVPDLTGLPYLRLLDVSSTGVTTLAGVASCPTLEEVNVTMCGMLDNVDALAALPKLRTLLANGVHISSLAWTGKCTGLRVLMLSSPVLADLTPLGSLRNLRRLGLSNSPANSIQWVGGCRLLEQLYLGSCRDLQDLRPVSQLKYLRMIDASMSGAKDVTGISGCTSLQEANFMCTSLTPESVKELKSMNLKQLEV